jgi:hypothetical protein
MKSMIVLAAAIVGLGAAGSAPESVAQPAKPAPRFQKNQCFYTNNVTSFAAPDDRNLYVRVGVRDVYHFEMFGRCPDIDWNQRLALVSRSSSWICNGMDAEVITHAAGLGHQRCPVRHMEKLTPEQVAALPKRARP